MIIALPLLEATKKKAKERVLFLFFFDFDIGADIGNKLEQEADDLVFLFRNIFGNFLHISLGLLLELSLEIGVLSELLWR